LLGWKFGQLLSLVVALRCDLPRLPVDSKGAIHYWFWSMCAHSVESHLRIPLEEYDQAIRAFVPHYDELLENGVTLLSRLAPRDPHVVELGSGTGRFSQAILKGLPAAKLTLVDIDAEILGQARRRLVDASSRVTFREGSFFDPLPAADAIVASLSLHHVHDFEKKTSLYRSIKSSLKPGGIFLCLDAVVSSDTRISTLTFENWIAFMGEAGISPIEAKNHLKAWEKEDRYFPLHQELSGLAIAGFDHPECFWRRGPLAIYGGTV
jgi:SAM-dependent methyltransferase